MAKVVVVIPTYNERDNIGVLIPKLLEQQNQTQYELHVLVVDDSSPDATSQIVQDLQQHYQNVHLMAGGKKAGLGAAYIRGMTYALDHLGADVVMEMDADWSHKPEDVPKLLANLEQGADFVIGSRYVPGGSIPDEWGTLRRMISFFGNLVARHLADLRGVRDCTAGFRAIRASTLRQIDFESLRVQGYAFQVALLHGAVIRGARVVEVPVDFIDRTKGQSKLGLRDIIEFVINAWWIRLNASRTFIKFALVGVSGVVVNLGLLTLLLNLNVDKFLASPIAIESSIIWNFFLNNYWTFRWRRAASRTRIRGLKFNVVSFFTLAISYGVFISLSFVFPNGSPQIHQLIGILPAMFFNYFLNSYWTFREAVQPSE